MNYIINIKHNVLLFLDKILMGFYYYRLPILLYKKGEDSPYILKIRKRNRRGKTKWMILYSNDKKKVLIYDNGNYLFKLIKNTIDVIKYTIHRAIEIDEKDYAYKYYN